MIRVERSTDMRIRQLLLFDLLLLAITILVTRIGCLIHEVVGHALFAHLLGAHLRSIEVTLFAGGSVDWWYDCDRSWAYNFWPTAMGMLLNLFTGAIALAFARRFEGRPILGPLCAFFGAGSILLPLAYWIIGLYYGVGDPESLWVAHLSSAEYLALRSHPWNGLRLALPFLPLTPLISYWVVRPYCRIQQARFPSATHLGRVWVGVLTCGVAGVGYLALYALTDRFVPQHLIVFDAAKLAAKEAAHRAQPVGNFPVIPAVAFLYVLGAVLAQRKSESASSAKPLSTRAVISVVLAAVAILALIQVCYL